MPLHKRYPKRAHVTVRQIMSIPPIVAKTETSIQIVAKEMWDKNIGSIVVVDPGGNIAGIVTERDILYAASKGLFEKEHHVSVNSIMSKNVVTVSEEDTVLQAVEKMRSFNIRHLMVVNSDSKLVGVISSRDILDASIEFLEVLQPPD